MKLSYFASPASLLVLFTLTAPVTARAEIWLVPAETNFSGDSPTVAIDASNSDDLLSYGRAINLEQITAIAPDGANVTLDNAVRGRSRSAFELRLTQPGTTRVVTSNSNVRGTYVVNGKTYRLDTFRRPGAGPGGANGPAQPGQGGQQGPGAGARPPGANGGPPPGAGSRPLAGLPGGRPLPGVSDPSQIPAGATEIKLVQASARSETFITRGAPTDWKPTGRGLELVPGGTPPTDVVVDEAATFKFSFDGKPAAGAEVEVASANERFQTTSTKLMLKADANGLVTVKWPSAGVYWMNATAEGPGTIANAVRHGEYTTTVLVQKP
ncbi:MAG: hypothetical protein B7Y99_00185 [Caulobacterales bacterium 32-69-10]|nr:MAG: hypothetical protein B7Y99_00185 [Caulobacterales bacterium 32-69-10]